jgi:pyruvate kinase
MQLLWGVQAVQGVQSQNSDEMVANSVASALRSGAIKEGDLIVITAGVPVGMSGTTNMLRVYVVGDVLIKGTGIGQKVIIGPVCVAETSKDVKNKYKPGNVLVVNAIDDETAPFAATAAAIIAEEGGLTSHAAIVGISYGIPVIVGAAGATKRLTDGMIVTVDAARGSVYQGEINAR